MNYTDENAVLPAQDILICIAIICAVLFFANVWRRTWLLLGVGPGAAGAVRDPARMIWPGVVQQFQVDPTEADKEAPYIGANIEATRAAYHLGDIEVQDYTSTDLSNPTSASVLAQTASAPAGGPPSWCTRPSSRCSRCAPTTRCHVLDVDRYTIDGARTARWCSACASSTRRHQRRRPQLVEPAHRLHPRQRRDRRVRNQRGPDNSTRAGGRSSWAEGQQADEDAAAALSPTATRRRVYFGEDSPDYSIVGKPSGANDVELDLGAAGGTPRTPTYDVRRRGRGAGRCSPRPGAVRGEVRRPQLRAVGAGLPNSKVLYVRQPAERVEKVAPWLTLDQDPYPAVSTAGSSGSSTATPSPTSTRWRSASRSRT